MSIWSELADPFPVNAIKWRIGHKTRDGNSAMLLAYIDARHVMDRLDEVVGAENWQDSYREQSSGIMVCELSVKIGDKWITKSDGAGETKIEAEKGKLSDAFKRAAVKFGIGRYLYRFDEVDTWVKLDDRGRFTPPGNLPDWAKPSGSQKSLPMGGEDEPTRGRPPSRAYDALNELHRRGQKLIDPEEYFDRVDRLMRHSFDTEDVNELDSCQIKLFYNQVKEMVEMIEEVEEKDNGETV